MSQRKPPVKRIRIVCTDRGRHPQRVLGVLVDQREPDVELDVDTTLNNMRTLERMARGPDANLDAFTPERAEKIVERQHLIYTVVGRAGDRARRSRSGQWETTRREGIEMITTKAGALLYITTCKKCLNLKGVHGRERRLTEAQVTRICDAFEADAPTRSREVDVSYC